MLVPSAIDIVGSSLGTIALTMSAASVFEMIRGNIIVVNAIISITILKRK